MGVVYFVFLFEFRFLGVDRIFIVKFVFLGIGRVSRFIVGGGLFKSC